MMIAHGSSSLPYESLPTEEGGAPRTAMHREADRRHPMITHHPIPMSDGSFRCGKWITGVQVAVLLSVAIVLGVVVAITARRGSYHTLFGDQYSTVAPSIDEHTYPGGAQEQGQSTAVIGGQGPTEHPPSSGSSEGHGTAATTAAAVIITRIPTTPTITTTPLPPPTTTPTTTPLITTPTTTTPTTTTSTTTTTRPPTTIQLITTPVPTAAPTAPATTPVPVTSAASEAPSVYGETATNGTDPDQYDSHLGIVDTMVVWQNKMPVGLVLTILVFVILGSVVVVAVIVWVVRSKNTARRRRAHVRRAINELREQDKSNLLQSDDEV